LAATVESLSIVTSIVSPAGTLPTRKNVAWFGPRGVSSSGTPS